MRARWVVAGVAVVGLAAAGYVVSNDEPATSFCTADGLIGPNGEIYGRRHPDCRFVDEDGDVICWAATQPIIVSCDEPGARPAG